MKIIKNIVILFILISFMIISIFGNYTYAENEIDGTQQEANETTENNTSGNNDNTNSGTSQENNQANETNSNQEEKPKTSESNKEESNTNANSKTTSTPKTNSTKQTTDTNNEEKTNNDSNANLVSLGIRPHDFKGFVPSKMEYSVDVPEDVDEVEVYAKAESASAKVTGTGKTKLNKGKNKIEVVVTSKDGNMNTYIINITRGEEDRIIDPTQGLKSLKVKDLELNPSFSTGIYEYKIKYKGEADKLDIETEATDSTYKVEIVGNENLKDGENIVTIIVSDSEGENVATYQICINKNVIDQDDIDGEKNSLKKEFFIAGGITLGIIAIIIIISIIRHIINKRRDYYDYDEDYDEEDDYIDDEIDDNYEEEDLPKAFVNKEEQVIDNLNEKQEDNQDENNEVLDQEVKEEIEEIEKILKKYNNDKENETIIEEDNKDKNNDQIKRQYLEGFDSEFDEYDDERPKRQGKKGKRFK